MTTWECTHLLQFGQACRVSYSLCHHTSGLGRVILLSQACNFCCKQAEWLSIQWAVYLPQQEILFFLLGSSGLFLILSDTRRGGNHSRVLHQKTHSILWQPDWLGVIFKKPTQCPTPHSGCSRSKSCAATQLIASWIYRDVIVISILES